MFVEIPDSPTATAAAEFAAVAAPPFLLNHSYRTYLFGTAVAPADVDHEAAFVAAMIHDLGLTESHRGDRDFGEIGAELAGRFLTEHGWGQGRVRLVEQAILRHTNIAPEADPTHRVVQAGATIDVVGLGWENVPSDRLAAILQRYPRRDFVESMRAAFLDEAARIPDGSFAELEHSVALSERFSTNPIDAAVASATDGGAA